MGWGANQRTLTAGTDNYVGTENDDTFEAHISQNPFAGGVSNTLSSADRLDGGAGYDKLYAEIVPEYFGATGDNQIDIQPRTTNIEQVEFEARDLAQGFWFSPDPSVTVDAKHMYGVERIGSKQSDGDLVIENLTTLANDGTKRNTSEMTITMDHTGPFNSNDAASDLTVYFDNNYLIAGEQSEESVQLRIVNNFELAENNAPLTGFQTVKFNVGDQEVVVNITDATTYQGVVNAINAQLAAQGITGVQAATAPERSSVFSDDVPAGAGYVQGELAGYYLPINIVSTSASLAAGPIELESNIQNFDGLNTWVDGGQVTTDDPISVNIELTKVGRGGEGGDLTIGGKAHSNLEGQGIAGGIEVFNVTVKGGDHLPNSLGVLQSTNGALQTVNIASEVLLGQETFASLEIREGFGKSLTLVDAADFRGDLLLGTEDAIVNLGTLNAIGGGDVTFFGEYDGSARGSNAQQFVIITGEGNDRIEADVNGVSTSGSTPTSLHIDAGNGNNKVVVDSDGLSPLGPNPVTVITGSGNDTEHGNGTGLTTHTGAGNDVIYAENTGAKAKIQLDAGDSSYFAATGTGTATAVSAIELLHGRTVQVTVAMPEGTNNADAFVDGFEVTAEIRASEGYVTTERDLYEAVARAINNNSIVSKLAKASVDSNGHLKIEYLVDGATALNDQLVEIEVLGDWADNAANHNNILQGLKVAHQDSGILIADVGALYASDVENKLNHVEQTSSVDLGTDSITLGENFVNGGQGDDVIVLSSNAVTTDTVEFDAGQFGNDTIVHFTAGTAVGADVLDFSAWLNNQTSASGSVESRVDVGITLNSDTTVTANEVTVLDFSALAIGGTATFDNMTDAQVLTALNAWGNAGTTAALVGNTQHSLLLVQNDGNTVAGVDNEGEYKVYQVTSGNSATNQDFTAVTLVGSIDFGETQAFDTLNFAV